MGQVLIQIVTDDQGAVRLEYLADLVRLVVFQVAALAPGAQVAWVVVLRRVVEMGDGQHHPRAGDRMWRVVRGAAGRVGRAAFGALVFRLWHDPGHQCPG